MLKTLVILVLLVAVAQAAIRLSPLPRNRMSALPGPFEPGVHPSMGGLKVVRPLSELPANAVDTFFAIVADTPRTERIGAGTEPAAFVTRSRLWGFPDIAVIWSDGENLHVHSHLVFGRGDMGVNAARVGRWFEKLERGEG